MINELKDVSVLVTGGNGFIGSHLTKKLVSLGARVNLLVEPNSSLWRIKEIKKKIKIFSIDIRHSSDIKRIIKKIRPVKIYHLAALVDVSRDFDLIDKIIEINFLGTINLLKALKGIKYDCFINTGTSDEYGNNNVPFGETQREDPVSPYSLSKVCNTYFCQMLWKIEKSPIVTIRPFITYGPYQINNMLIPSLIRSCLTNKELALTKGEQKKEFNYVSDIIEGYIKASITKNVVGNIINLGSGVEYKIKEVVDLIVKFTKPKIRPRLGELKYRAGESMHSYCLNNKAKEILNWEPKVNLQQGLYETVKWYRLFINKISNDDLII